MQLGSQQGLKVVNTYSSVGHVNVSHRGTYHRQYLRTCTLKTRDGPGQSAVGHVCEVGFK